MQTMERRKPCKDGWKRFVRRVRNVFPAWKGSM